MTNHALKDLHDPAFAEECFTPATLDDEIRIDRLCVELLQTFCRAEIAAGRDPLDAGSLARGADYFLRDFIVDNRRENLFGITPQQVRQFAGNWYIISNLEPNREELAGFLSGIAAFYLWLGENGRIPAERARAIAEACREIDHYAGRIESFWQIEKDGYALWDAACPLGDA